MKKFLIKGGVLMLISSLFIVGIFYFISNGFKFTIDYNYGKLVKQHDNSLILGTSRAAQGIDPLILNKEFPQKKDFYNLSFTIDLSPFGKTYYEFIKKFTSLKSGSKNYSFIIAVDPWAIRQPKNSNYFAEDDGFLNKLMLGPHDPNLEYLLRFEQKNLVFNKLIVPKVNYLNHAGRVIINLDSQWIVKNFKANLALKIQDYKQKDVFKSGMVSEVRMKYLILIIEYCKSFGKVNLVRMPISPELMQLENSMHREFNNLMASVAAAEMVKYYDFTNLNGVLQTTDGNHLWNPDVIRFSKLLADSLKVNEK